MPTTFKSTVQEWQDEFFDLIERVQEPVVRLTGDAADSLAEYVPEAPAWPFLAQLPTVNDLVEYQIAFTTRFVEHQAAYTRSLVKSLSPVLARTEPKAAPARKPRRAAAAAPKAA